MRKALIVGINDYSFGPLKGCIPDANKMYNFLSRDYDNTPNFAARKLSRPTSRLIYQHSKKT